MRMNDLHTFDGAEHRDRRRDDSIAVEQRRAEKTEGDQEYPAPTIRRATLLLKQQREERENPALAAVVRTHDEDDVLHAHHDDEQPYNQRQHAVHIQLRRLESVLGIEALTQCVQRARPDVAVDDAERDQRQSRQTPAAGLRFRALSMWTHRGEESAGARWFFGRGWSRSLGRRRRRGFGGGVRSALSKGFCSHRVWRDSARLSLVALKARSRVSSPG